MAFVVALSVIVAIHEYGHYIVGRWSGIHADVFSLGFGPVLFSRVDMRGTQWQFALLPFGGYVKFKGDSNPSGGTDSEAMTGLSAAERRSTMTGAPLWARAATVAAGPVFNFMLSIIIFTGIFMLRGVLSEPLTVGELRPLPVQQQLQVGDEIAAIEGAVPPAFDDPVAFSAFLDDLPAQEQLTYTVVREGTEREVMGPYVYPPLVGQVVPRSAASDIALQAGDVIRSIDGTPIFAFEQLREQVEASEGAPLALNVWRDGEEKEMTLAPRRTDEPQPDNSFRTVYRIGVAGAMFFEPATVTPGRYRRFRRPWGRPARSSRARCRGCGTW